MNDPAPAASPGCPSDGEVTVLVVDDSVVERHVAGAMVERTPGWKVVYADNGRSALAAMEREKPRIVLTDLLMPEMDGLELVEAVRARYPLVPVVLMTAFGNEEIALRALRQGAAGYVPKKSLDRDLTETLEQVLAAAQQERRQERMLGRLTRAELHFTLENDPALIPSLVAHLQAYLMHLGLCDLTGKTRVGVALEEALVNAMYHGNLEVSSDLRRHGDEPFYRRIDERRRKTPYRSRQVHCAARLSGEEAVFVVRDEGPGFDPALLPDPTDPANLGEAGGRGLLLIRAFMDEVTFNAAGNEVTLVKRRDHA